MNRYLSVLLICFIGSTTAFGHEVLTHQNIGNVAVAYLQQTDRNRQLPSNLQPLLLIGAVQEDNAALPQTLGGKIGNNYRYFFHFLPALNFAIGVFGNVNATCGSIQWGVTDDNQCTATCTIPVICDPSIGSATSVNAFRWDRDLTPDHTTGAPTTSAIEQFGYFVHLLEDLGSPPHTRNDIHPCVLGVIYCDPFERDNNGATPSLQVALSLPTGGAAIIPTDGFSIPEEFFTSLRNYVSTNYYSENTVFAPGLPGPAAVLDDSRYFYGSCIEASVFAGTCETVNGMSVRKSAHKGPWYWAFCAPELLLNGNNETACDKTRAGIDSTIAQEQFAELGPVIAQQVAAFIRFYAPALSVQTLGNPNATITSTSAMFPDGTQIADLSAAINCATCSAVFPNGGQITLIANDNGGSAFKQWSGDCAGTENPLTITLVNDMNCTAEFGALPAVVLSPYGSQNLSATPGPYDLYVVDSNLSPVSGPGIITVTVLRQVFSECSGLLFVSQITASVPQGQTSVAFASAANVAGRDPACMSLPITTTFTVQQATLAPNTLLNLSTVPSQQLTLSITR